MSSGAVVGDAAGGTEEGGSLRTRLAHVSLTFLTTDSGLMWRDMTTATTAATLETFARGRNWGIVEFRRAE